MINNLQYAFERTISFDQVGEYWSGDDPILVSSQYFLDNVNVAHYNHLSNIGTEFPGGTEFREDLRRNLKWSATTRNKPW